MTMELIETLADIYEWIADITMFADDDGEIYTTCEYATLDRRNFCTYYDASEYLRKKGYRS